MRQQKKSETLFGHGSYLLLEVSQRQLSEVYVLQELERNQPQPLFQCILFLLLLDIGYDSMDV